VTQSPTPRNSTSKCSILCIQFAKLCSAVTHVETLRISKLGVKSYMMLVYCDHYNKLIYAKQMFMHIHDAYTHPHTDTYL
jgi:hypothetical protein